MVEINGKEYPLWSQFVERKNEWVGGILEDRDMGMVAVTEITDIELRPNGEDDAFFEVCGKNFGCGFSTSVGGIGPGSGEAWLNFYGYGGHHWRIKKPTTTTKLKGAGSQKSPLRTNPFTALY